MVAAAAAGAALTRARPAWVRALAAVAGVVAFMIVFGVLDAALSPLAAEGTWQRDEMEIVGTALIALAAAIGGILYSRRRTAQVPSRL